MGIGSKHVDQIGKWLSAFLPVNEEKLGRLQTEYQEVSKAAYLSIPLVVTNFHKLSNILSGRIFYQSDSGSDSTCCNR